MGDSEPWISESGLEEVLEAELCIETFESLGHSDSHPKTTFRRCSPSILVSHRCRVFSAQQDSERGSCLQSGIAPELAR